MWESTCVKLCIQVGVKIWKISVHIPRRRFLGCNQHLSRSLGISPQSGDLKIMKMDEEKVSTSMQGNGHPN